MKNRVTIKEIAYELGLSQMSVSRALNNQPKVSEKTRKKVLKTAQKLGYTPNHIAKSLVLKKTYTLGIIIPEIANTFYSEVLRGVEEITSKLGYEYMLTHSSEDVEKEIRAIKTLERKRVDGMLFSIAQAATNYETYRSLLKKGYPVVFFDRIVGGSIDASSVSIDDENSAKNITEHLIKHGYKNIAHLYGSKRLSIGRGRYKGFISALEESGLTIREELIVKSGFHVQGGYYAMQQILSLSSKKLPRAVVAVNNLSAFGAIRAIKEHGLKIPEDIAIVGFWDDVTTELIDPPLTTVNQPAYEMGKCAAKLLLKQIDEGAKESESVILDTEIIIRRSCGCKYEKKLGM